MPSNVITLPRSQLYELVWSKPVTELAKEFGISDVALAKRCRAIRIPLPPRGYWARVAAGQKPRRPPLPPFRGSRRRFGLSDVDGLDDPQDPGAGLSEFSSRTVTRQGPPSASSQGGVPSVSGEKSSGSPRPDPTVTFTPRPPPTHDADPMSPEESDLRARIAALDLAPLGNLTEAHPAVLRTAVHARLLKSTAITWPRGTRSGPILDMTRVSAGERERTLHVLDAVLRGATLLGWKFTRPPGTPDNQRPRPSFGPRHRQPTYGWLHVEDEPITLRIDERNRRSDHVPTEKEKAEKKTGRYVWMPRYDYHPSGELSLHAIEPAHSYTMKTFRIHASRPLDHQARRILEGLLDIALARKRRREEQRLQEIADREYERQQQIMRARRAAQAALIEQLECQAGAWSRAQLLRRYVRAARRALGTAMVTSELAGESVDFLAWAEHYVNQLDPLHPEPRDPDLAHESDFRYGADNEHHAEEQRRLSGHDWEKADKLVAPNTSGP